MKTIIITLLILFIIANIIADQISKKRFKEKYFPPNIIFPLREDVQLPNIKEESTTPKIIHRCYSTFEKMKAFQEVFDKTNERMPDFKQIYYDDQKIEEFIQNNYSERIYTAYKNINPDYGAARADFFRYLVVYFYGGVYMDIKSGPKKKIKKFFDKDDDKLLVSLGGLGVDHLIPNHHFKGNDINKCGGDNWSYITNIWKGSEWQQYAFSSPKGNPILGKIIQQVVSNIEEGMENKNLYSSGRFSVVAMTGPIVFSMVIEKYKNNYKDKIKFYNFPGLGGKITHTLIDYKSIMKDKRYVNLKNKQLLV